MSSSCFKIISCGKNDSVDNEEDHVEPSPQGKDKRGWSFRKRSARHRVLSNTVTSETPPSGNKATPVSAALDFQCQPISDVPEKVPAVVFKEDKSKLSTPVSSKLSEAIAANSDEPIADAKPDEPDVKPDEPKAYPDEPDVKPHEPTVKTHEPDSKTHESDVDSTLDESVVIIIQSAVRAFLAQKALLESKNIIKLQAAVRGHLERRHAVGTLRCVQAIVKMQVLVRARRARKLLDESVAVEGHGKGKENARMIPHVTYTSIEKLLSNKFARQLMDSPQGTKSINIKCDPSKSDSAWKWLERWMAVSPTDDQSPLGTVAQNEKNREQTATQESTSLIPDAEEIGTKEDIVVLHDKKEDKHTVIQEQTSVLHDEKETEDFVIQEKMVVPSESNCKPEFNFGSEVSESDSKLIMDDENMLGIQAHEGTSTLSNNVKQLETHISVDTTSEQNNPVSGENKQLELPGTGELSVDAETETKVEQSFESQERSALENSETQGEKHITGSRKANNPNFLAAQSKFEELSSVSNLTKSLSSKSQTAEDETYVDAESKFKELKSVASLTKSMSSTSQTAEDGSYLDALASFTDRASRKESFPVEDIISSSSNIQLSNSDTSDVQLGSDASKIQLGGSECGTELSITSTLDSPERSDVGPSDIELGGKVLEDMNGKTKDKESLVVEAKVEPTVINARICESDAIQPERVMGNDDHAAASSVTVEVPIVEQTAETDVSKLQLEMEPEKGNSISKLSPEASPRTHATAPESQGTPSSSEVSGKPKKIKGEKSASKHKLRSSSAGKTSPSNLNHGPGGRSSGEQSQKDHKSAKRRNSFGSPKADHVDQESRDSSSSNPLPSYMQPTQSAKAKALLNSSPRSSPDVLDKDVSLKKRHSLPGGHGSQGSSPIQRTLSEVPHTVKESQSQQDKKWRR